MSDIQRYTFFGTDEVAEPEKLPADYNGRYVYEYVTYADHVAAVAAARAESQDGDDFWPSRVRHAEERGFKAGVKAARDAADVALLGTLQTTRDRVIAAIDAVQP